MSKATTLAGLVADVAAHNPTKTAIIFQDQPISYGQLHGMIELVANALAARGIGHGDRVAIMLPNIPQFAAAYYAIARLGGIVVPLNLLYKADQPATSTFGIVVDDITPGARARPRPGALRAARAHGAGSGRPRRFCRHHVRHGGAGRYDARLSGAAGRAPAGHRRACAGGR